VSSPVSADRANFKPSSASSVFNNLSQYVAAKANDGNITTLWASASAGNQFWQVDLSSGSHIQQIKVVTRQDSDVALHRKNFEIRASNDPTFASYSVLASQGSTPLPYQSTFSSDVTNSAPFRYVRVAKTDGASFAIGLVQVKAADFVAPPEAPANLTASAIDSTQIRLSWNVTSSNEAGFKLERKTGAGGTYLQIATPPGGKHNIRRYHSRGGDNVFLPTVR
jgi:hypothetical protein